MNFNEQSYLNKVHDNNIKNNSCKSDSTLITDVTELSLDIAIETIENKDIEYSGTYVLEKFLFCQAEFNKMPFDETKLGRGRVVSVNPGSDNIGREQRYIHYYIVLAEYKNMFIGVPITNMAFDKNNNKHYLRNPFEVELINPSSDLSKKPYKEYWTTKPSVADIRNISGLDKRRILNNNIYNQVKFAPQKYMDDIKSKMLTIFNI